MKAKGKGLQNLTETQKKIEQLMKKEKVVFEDIIECFSKDESKIFAAYLTEKFNSLKGAERDIFIEKIEAITLPETKNDLWEFNHIEITRAISKYIEEYGKMPGKAYIASETGLSRQTIHKHLKEFENNPYYADEIRKFKFMADRVLAKVFKIAVHGDTKAARLYFEVLGMLGNGASQNTTIKNQNNYIQINGRVLSQDAIKQLGPEQLRQIEGIIMQSESKFPKC